MSNGNQSDTATSHPLIPIQFATVVHTRPYGVIRLQPLHFTRMICRRAPALQITRNLHRSLGDYGNAEIISNVLFPGFLTLHGFLLQSSSQFFFVSYVCATDWDGCQSEVLRAGRQAGLPSLCHQSLSLPGQWTPHLSTVDHDFPAAP